MVSVRYGSVRKKSRLIADRSAVTSAAERPPSSATMIVKPRNTKARFDADVRERNGISAIPSAIDPSAPATIHTRPSSSCFILILLPHVSPGA